MQVVSLRKTSTGTNIGKLKVIPCGGLYDCLFNSQRYMKSERIGGLSLPNFKRAAAALLIICTATVGSYTVGHMMGTKDEQLKEQEVIKNEYISKVEAAIQSHNQVQQALDGIAKKHSEELSEMESRTSGIIDDLRVNNKRLRVRIKEATSGDPSDNSKCLSSVDGKAELDEGDAKRLISVAQRGDMWIQSLQDTVRALQQTKGESYGPTK